MQPRLVARGHCRDLLAPGDLGALLDTGISDWGGVSPITPDFVNPEAPWPHLLELGKEGRGRGIAGEDVGAAPEDRPEHLEVPAEGVEQRQVAQHDLVAAHLDFAEDLSEFGHGELPAVADLALRGVRAGDGLDPVR